MRGAAPPGQGRELRQFSMPIFGSRIQSNVSAGCAALRSAFRGEGEDRNEGLANRRCYRGGNTPVSSPRDE